MARMGLEKRNDPKLNIAFYDDHLDFLRYASGKKHMNVTQYINYLIANDMKNYDRSEWKAFVEEKKGPSLDDIIRSADARRQQTPGDLMPSKSKDFEL